MEKYCEKILWKNIMETVKAEDFIEYSHYEIECPYCGGMIDTDELPCNGELVKCKECDEWSEIIGDFY